MSRPSVDLAKIAAGLSETFADLAPVRIVGVLGRGFNSIAVETGSGLVFRVAKTPGTAERYARESCLLPIIHPHLPIAIPNPRWLSDRSPVFPYGVSGYEKLPGVVLSPALLRTGTMSALAEQTAQVLLALHHIPLDAVARCGLARPEDSPAQHRTVREETTPVLRARLSAGEFARIERWWDAFLEDKRLSQFEPALTHNDFWYENMLVEGTASRLVGVVDWEYAAISDPAVDFSFHLGPDFRTRVIDSYRRAGGRFAGEEEHRMRRLWELREFYGVHHSVRFQDEAELADSIRKLLAGPIFDHP